MVQKHAVVDGSNIATEGRSEPSLAQLNEAVASLVPPAATASAAPPMPTNTPDVLSPIAEKLPRPTGVELEPAPPGVIYYKIQRPFDEIIGFYRTEMTLDDWLLSADEAVGDDGKLLIYTKDQLRVTITIREMDDLISVQVGVENIVGE